MCPIVFCFFASPKSDTEPKFLQVWFVQKNPHIKQGHSSSSLVTWSSSGFLCFLLLQSCGFEAFPFPVCLTLSAPFFFKRVFLNRDEVMTVALISVFLVSLGLCSASAGFGKTASLICLICCPEVSVVAVREHSHNARRQFQHNSIRRQMETV